MDAKPVKLITVNADDYHAIEGMVVGMAMKILNNEPVPVPEIVTIVNFILGVGRTDRVTWETK